MDTDIQLGVDVSDLALTRQEIAFVGEYANSGFKADVAFRKAKLARPGMSDIDIRVETNAMLARRDVKLALKRIVDPVVNVYKDIMDSKMVSILDDQMDWDIRDFYNDDGTIKPLNKIPKAKRQAITGIKRTISQGTEIITYELVSKQATMKMVREIMKGIDAETGESNIPEDARKSVRDILNAGLHGIQVGMKMKQAELEKKDSTIKTETFVIPDSGEDDEPIYVEEIRVEQARDNKIAEHPLVKKAREATSNINVLKKAESFARKEMYGNE